MNKLNIGENEVFYRILIKVWKVGEVFVSHLLSTLTLSFSLLLSLSAHVYVVKLQISPQILTYRSM